MSRAETLHFKSGGRDQRFDRAAGGDRLQSTAKQQLAADRVDRAEKEKISLRERVATMEEALEENSNRLDEILGLLKKEGKGLRILVVVGQRRDYQEGSKQVDECHEPCLDGFSGRNKFVCLFVELI